MTAIDELLARLVAIDSRNPALASDGPGEAAIAAVVAEFLRDAGLDVELLETRPGRPSVIGWLRGRAPSGGRNLLLNAHTDTVGFGAMAHPLVPRVAGVRLYGRGAYDMKGGLAAVLAAAAMLAQGEPLRGDLVVTAVADEEHASLGTKAVISHLGNAGARVDGAISPSRPTCRSAWRTRASPGRRSRPTAARPTAAAAPTGSTRSPTWAASWRRSSGSTS